MIRLRLREAMRRQERATGRRVTYGSLGTQTGLLLPPIDCTLRSARDYSRGRR